LVLICAAEDKAIEQKLSEPGSTKKQDMSLGVKDTHHLSHWSLLLESGLHVLNDCAAECAKRWSW
jgi:hypothetical protein